MWFYHQNIISFPFSFRNMLLQEDAHQCDRRSFPWENLPSGQSCICHTRYHNFKGLHTWKFTIGVFYFTSDRKASYKCVGTCRDWWEFNLGHLSMWTRHTKHSQKVAKETYKKHENDTKSVHMWAQENLNLLFYYQDTRFEVGGKLSRTNNLVHN
jgi:hypothetical protein